MPVRVLCVAAIVLSASVGAQAQRNSDVPKGPTSSPTTKPAPQYSTPASKEGAAMKG